MRKSGCIQTGIKSLAGCLASPPWRGLHPAAEREISRGACEVRGVCSHAENAERAERTSARGEVWTPPRADPILSLVTVFRVYGVIGCIPCFVDVPEKKELMIHPEPLGTSCIKSHLAQKQVSASINPHLEQNQVF